MRSLQRICSIRGIGILPNKLKISASEIVGNGDFSHLYYKCIACKLTVSNYLYGFFCRNNWKTKLASSASVATNAQKRPNRHARNGRFFKLVEAPPQSPTNTKYVLKTQPSGLRLRDSANRWFCSERIKNWAHRHSTFPVL